MKCKVNVVNRNSIYVHQIIAGVTLLSSYMDLEVVYSEKPALSKEFYHDAVVELEVDGKRVIYDLTDGYNNYPSFADLDKTLNKVDYYFKSNINRSFHNGFANESKIKGLAPRYNVTCANSWADHLDWASLFKLDYREMRRLYDRLPLSKQWLKLYDYKRFEMSPIPSSDPRVFFYTRLWDPSIASVKSSQNKDLDGQDASDRIEKKKEEYEKVSALRAGLVRALKKEFGNRFIGGIAPDSYSGKAYPELLGENISYRKKFMKSMHLADICVNTQGTHKCWNFSFGEEVAASRAIVTEQPFYEDPVFLEEGKNFLTYRSIDDCVEQVYDLLDDRQKLTKMMEMNHEYYRSHLRPDKYVLDSLHVVLGEQHVSDKWG